jgi:hypothetical protein
MYEIVFASLSFDGSEQETIYCTAPLHASKQVFRDASASFRRSEKSLQDILARTYRKKTAVLFAFGWRSFRVRTLKVEDIWKEYSVARRRIISVARAVKKKARRESLKESTPTLDEILETRMKME